jgi:hypothetical protein
MKKILGWKILGYGGSLLIALASQVAHPRAALSGCDDQRAVNGGYSGWSLCTGGSGTWLCYRDRFNDYCTSGLPGYDCVCGNASPEVEQSYCSSSDGGQTWTCNRSAVDTLGTHLACSNYQC